tara:strand:+ start:218 stop:847 length:630 start_codon:yes stop_codon:yes gene_type:complete
VNKKIKKFSVQKSSNESDLFTSKQLLKYTSFVIKIRIMLKYAIILSFLSFVSCNVPCSSIKGNYLGFVESKTNIGDPAAEIYEDSWLPIENREEMLVDLFKKVKNKELEVFDFFPGELTPMADSDLEYILHHVDTEFVEDEKGNIDTIQIEETFDVSGVVYLKFKEELYYSKATGGFEKKVKYVCPMEQVYNEDGTIRGYRGLFWIKLN